MFVFCCSIIVVRCLFAYLLVFLVVSIASLVVLMQLVLFCTFCQKQKRVCYFVAVAVSIIVYGQLCYSECYCLIVGWLFAVAV